MKTTVTSVVLTTLPALAGDFINLGFNEPDLSGRLVPLAAGGPYLGLTAQILPGWMVTADGKAVTEGTYSKSNQGSGVTEFTLREGQPSSQWGFYLLFVSLDSDNGKPGPDLWLSQTGRIPLDAIGISVYGGANIEGYLNGNLLGFIDPTSGKPTTWDVSSYQGKEVELSFHVKHGSIRDFDIIGFTTVPEPSEFAMLGLGFGLMGWQCWKRRGYHASGGSR
jgi:hypothetical protein